MKSLFMQHPHLKLIQWTMIFIFTVLVLDSRSAFGQRNLSMYLSAIKLEPEPPPCRSATCPGHPYSGGIITFENGQVDISAFVGRAEALLQQSDYQNVSFFDTLWVQTVSTFQFECYYHNLSKDQVEDCIEHVRRSSDAAEIRLRQAQAGRLLLPDNLSSVGGLSNRYVRRYRRLLESDCPSVCGDVRVSAMIGHGTPEQSEEALQKLSARGPDCLKKALYALGQQIQNANDSIHYPDDCNGQTGRQRSVCQRLLNDKTQLTERLSNLTDLVLSQTSSEAVQSLNTCLENEPAFSALGEFLDDLDDEMTCRPYQRGEERDVSVGWSDYKVKREADGSYTASIAMRFSPAEDYDNEDVVPKDQVPTHYFQKAQDCLEEANPKMLGPNGEQLNIVIEQPQADSCLPTRHITIQARGERSRSASYAADINCSTTVHEVLHEIGDLSDEYEESLRGYFVNADTGQVIEVEDQFDENPGEGFVFHPAYNCRVLQTNSIMSNDNEKWNKVFPPQGMIGSFGLAGISPVNTNVKPSDFFEDSLLEPAHFNAILYGDCQDREDVRVYRACAELAYQTAYRNSTSYTGRYPISEECPDVKSTCEQQDVLGSGLKDLQRDYRILNANLRGLNRSINQIGRNLVTLEQAAVQTGTVDNQRFNCANYGPSPPRRVDISTCKTNLRELLEYFKGLREDLSQKQERVRQNLSKYDLK